MRQVRIQWEGSFSIEEVLGLNHEENDYGLYQVYRKSEATQIVSPS